MTTALDRRPAQPIGLAVLNARIAWRGVAEDMALITAKLVFDRLFGSGHR